ncbi:unnamed protein product [Schistocephalus solidus]|uniref:POU domain protein n=1 Tax=Schistocephalus solidus TaxID=70667 RepID=A0A183SJP4_SCHSO|nr:unnamed protein product [Schistocephalus solidus]
MECGGQDRRDRRKSSKPRRQVLLNNCKNVRQDESESLDGSGDEQTDSTRDAKKPRLLHGTDSCRILCPTNLNVRHDCSAVLVSDANGLLHSHSLRLCSMPPHSPDLHNVSLSFITGQNQDSETDGSNHSFPTIKHVRTSCGNLSMYHQRGPLHVHPLQCAQSADSSDDISLSCMINKQDLENVYPTVLSSVMAEPSVSSSTKVVQLPPMNTVSESSVPVQKSTIVEKSTANSAVISTTASSHSACSLPDAAQSAIVASSSPSSQSISSPTSIVLNGSNGDVSVSVPHSVFAPAFLSSSLFSPKAAGPSTESVMPAPPQSESSGFSSSQIHNSAQCVNILRCSGISSQQNSFNTSTVSSASFSSPISISLPHAAQPSITQASQQPPNTPVLISQQPTFTLIGNLPSTISSLTSSLPATILSINNANNRNSLSFSGVGNGPNVSASVSNNVSAIAALLRGLAQFKQSSSDSSVVNSTNTVAVIAEKPLNESSCFSTPVCPNPYQTTSSSISMLSADTVNASATNTIPANSVDINTLAAAVAAVTGVFPKNPTITPGPVPGSILLSCAKPTTSESDPAVSSSQSNVTIDVSPQSIAQRVVAAGGGIQKSLVRSNIVQPALAGSGTISVIPPLSNGQAFSEISPRPPADATEQSKIGRSSREFTETQESTIDRILETIRGQMRASDSNKNKLIMSNGLKKSSDSKTIDILQPAKLPNENKESASYSTNCSSVVSKCQFPIKKTSGKLAPVAPNPATKSVHSSQISIALNRSTVGSIDAVHSKVYKCRYCGKSFNRKFCRERHERLHTGVKPYTCEVCDEKFIRLEDKKRHVRSILHTTRTAALACANGKIKTATPSADPPSSEIARQGQTEGPANEAAYLADADEAVDENDTDSQQLDDGSSGDYKEDSLFEAQLCIADDDTDNCSTNDQSDVDSSVVSLQQLSSANAANVSPTDSTPSFRHSRRSALKQCIVPVRVPSTAVDLPTAVPALTTDLPLLPTADT